MRFLDNEESWDLLRNKVFGEELCPPQLEKFGKMIAENCEGLPLMIIRVANLLSKANKTTEYWSEVAVQKRHRLFVDACHNMSKVLYPSYQQLNAFSKMCFLYMGVFPQTYEIPCTKLINMLIVEGFFKKSELYSGNNFYQHCLKDVFSFSLAMVCQSSSSREEWDYNIKREEWDYNSKTCSLHSSFWHLCRREAGKNKFFDVLNSCTDCLEEDIKNQNRLCVHNNILFGIKEVYDQMEENCASTARSLLFLGPYIQYPVPMFCGLRLLRVLDALNIRLYEFPMEVLELVLLRYLALTYNGNLPVSISKLWNLRFLIVGRHLRIKSFGAASYLPMEIWDMQELMHLQIMGTNLLQLPNSGASLKKLLRLLDVSPRCCTKEALRRIPNLRKLGIQIELTPHDDNVSLDCLNCIHHLHELRSLKCVVVNPDLRSKIVRQPAPKSMFRSGVQKLHLSGLGYPWEYMNIIASMPNLRVLKLRHYAFQGPKWEIQQNKFMELRFLLIEDTDVVQWRIGCGSFRTLSHLSIKHCYKLEEIHGEFDSQLDTIEVIDSNPSCAEEIKEAQLRKGYHVPDVHSSWDDGKLKSFESLLSWKKNSKNKKRKRLY